MAPQHSPQPGYPPNNFGSRATVVDFTKGIAHEVRYLLSEIGKLREERQRLQREIADLLAMRSKFDMGEFPPEWKPPVPAIEPAPAGPPVPAPEVPAAKGAWHVMSKKRERKPARTVPKAITAPAAPAPPVQEAPKPDAPAWAQWRPNPLLRPGSAVNSPSTAPAQIPNEPPPRTGLFGAPTPPPK